MKFDVSFQLIDVDDVQKIWDIVFIYFHFVECKNELTTFDIIDVNSMFVCWFWNRLTFNQKIRNTLKLRFLNCIERRFEIDTSHWKKRESVVRSIVYRKFFMCFRRFLSSKTFDLCVKIRVCDLRLFRLLFSKELSIWDFVFERSRITTNDKKLKIYCNIMNRALIDCWLID